MDEEDRQNRRGGPTFEPPVYKQRYDFVENIVREFGAKKVQNKTFITRACKKPDHMFGCIRQIYVTIREQRIK